MTDLSTMHDDPDDATGQSNKESRALSAERGALLKVQLRAERQRIHLRLSACIVALIVLIAAAYLELKLLCYIVDNHYSQISDLFILLAIAPIASITFIMIAVLLGVFRGYRDKDSDNVSPGRVIQLLGGGGNGS